MNCSCIVNKTLLVAIFLVSTSAQAVTDGRGILGQQEQMKNYVIADVGEVSKVEPPFNAKWEKDVYQLNGRCFLLSDYIGYWGYGSKAAFLLENAQKKIQLALVESAIDSIKVERHPVSMIKCPSGTHLIRK